jgi:hypothetical protein
LNPKEIKLYVRCCILHKAFSWSWNGNFFLKPRDKCHLIELFPELIILFHLQDEQKLHFHLFKFTHTKDKLFAISFLNALFELF